jgi:RNA polymerase sigma-70 factor (ECF subfamily)
LPQPTDEQLLAGIARSDAEAGREFFLRHRHGAYRVAWRLLGNEADAMDVVEDAFVKVLRAAGMFRGESSAKTWLYRIVTNTALDARRKRSRWVTLEGGDEEGADAKDYIPSREEGPEESAVRKETGDVIRKAIEALSEKHRAVFVLAAVEGLSYKETAEILEISPGTVMSRLFYARKYLQEMLEGYVGGENE